MRERVRRAELWLGVLALLLAMPHPAFAFQTPPAAYSSNQQGFSAPFDQGIADLDAYWNDVFRNAGVLYRSPQVRRFEAPIQTACGPVDPSTGPNYCPQDETIYLTFSMLPLIGIDTSVVYNWLTIAAHEWGHHIQHLLGVQREANNHFELQADCLAGAFTQHAKDLGRLDPGDVTEAAESSIKAGDPTTMPQNQPGAHGINDDRLTSFMDGYINGLLACGLPAPVGSVSPPPPASSSTVPPPSNLSPSAASVGSITATSTTRPPIALATLIPSALALSSGQAFRLYDEGAATFDDVVTHSPDPARARSQLQAWGWQENHYRVFTADNPPRNAAGWVELSIDRFDSVDGAAQALVADADARRTANHDQSLDLGLFADQSAAMAGPAYNGNEVTIYSRRGDLVIRATGITPKGDPTADVTEAILKILVPLVDDPRIVSPALFSALPTDANMPAGLRQAEEHARSGATIADTFPNAPEAERLFQQWGWRENAARYFTGRSSDGVTRIETSVFRFADPTASAQAVDYFVRGRAAGTDLMEVASPAVGIVGLRALAGPTPAGQEATIYFSEDAELFRVTAIGASDPMADLTAVLQSWLGMGVPTPIPTVTPSPSPTLTPTAAPTATPFPTPSPTPIPTPTPTATPTPPPTPTPAPTATATPLPTPTPTATATATPTTVPTAAALPTLPPPTPTATRSASTGCDLVELQPGYPGYRGWVTGIAGSGEAACLQDLEAQHPDFDKAAQDAANLAAAQQLGLAGSPTDWTWENWMAIEGVRGLPMSCYSCILLGKEPPPAVRMRVAWNDPRLLLGGYQTQTALLRATASLGPNTSAASFLRSMFDNDDLVFRATASALSPGSHNAPQLLDLEQSLITSMGANASVDPAAVWATVVEQGGYAPTPPNASPDDQILMIEEGAMAAGVWMPDRVRTGFFNEVDMWKEGWLSDMISNGPDISFGQWLKEHGAQIGA